MRMGSEVFTYFIVDIIDIRTVKLPQLSPTVDVPFSIVHVGRHVRWSHAHEISWVRVGSGLKMGEAAVLELTFLLWVHRGRKCGQL